MHIPRPHWIAGVPRSDGSTIAIERRKVYNRTGSATVAGGVYMLDLGLTETAETTANSEGIVLPAVTSHQWGVASGGWMNAILPVTANLRNGFFVLAEKVVANNEPFDALVSGPATMQIASSTGAQTAIASGAWTASTRTLTKASGFSSYTFLSGDTIAISGGTGHTPGDYVIESRTSANAIVLVAAAGLAASDNADTAGTVYVRYPAYSRVEAVNASSGGSIIFASTSNRKIATLSAEIRSVAAYSGTAAVHFNGYGF